ncbi:hypothetical protein DRO54_05470 [Candidatus Bathyarchaeota archaeon]|nr:MAG: hypothetical protein DRO54_05470 [Candidatus Bathyarchaeota archaeon]RLI55407.1 MAG: hypothetical protein DRP09_09930 [Candidatus Thorarchaeota archaeon]
MVNKDTVFEDTFNVIWDLINGNVPDPESRTNTQWIFASFPDTTKRTFGGYPIIIVSNPRLSLVRGMNFSKNMYGNTILVNLDIYDTKSSRIDTIGSLIYKAFRDNISTLKSQKLHNMRMNASTTSTGVINGKKIHNRTFVVIFDYAE